VTVSQKILFCFLLSALFFAGIAALAVTGLFGNYGGIPGKSTQILIPVAVFLTLFLIIFFCFNLRQDSSHKAVSTDSMSTDMIPADTMSDEAVQVESLTGLGGSFFMFSQPFTFTPGNPELLQGAGDEVVYEKNGIHYINSSVFVDDKNEEKLDRNFAKLIESVVNKKEFILE